MAEFANFFEGRTQGNPLAGSGIILTGNIREDMYNNEVPESDEGTIFLALAYTASFIPSTSITCGVDSFQQLYISVKFPRRYEPIQVEQTGGGRALERGDESPNGNIPTFLVGREVEEEVGDYNNENIEHCPDPEAAKLFRTIVRGQSDWKQFYIDLLGAYQVSSLTAGHVKSYLAWKKIPNMQGEYISTNFRQLTGGAPEVASAEELRDLMQDGKWKEYRLTFATIVGIVGKMIDALPDEFSSLFTPQTRGIIARARANYWSEPAFREIPTMVLAYAYCWTQVTEEELPGLWSGKRAYEDLTYAQKKSMTNLLTLAKSRISVWEHNEGPFSRDNFDKLPASLRDI
jgi:hypothetical protein